jgi:hypothetical protein
MYCAGHIALMLITPQRLHRVHGAFFEELQAGQPRRHQPRSTRIDEADVELAHIDRRAVSFDNTHVRPWRKIRARARNQSSVVLDGEHRAKCGSSGSNHPATAVG